MKMDRYAVHFSTEGREDIDPSRDRQEIVSAPTELEAVFYVGALLETGVRHWLKGVTNLDHPENSTCKQTWSD